VHGSFGTLAIVTDALFRLHPLPAAQQFVSVTIEGPEDAHRLAQAVLHAQVVPGALEVDLPPDGPGTLTVLLEGIAEGVLGRTATTVALLGGDATAETAAPAGWARYPWQPAGDGAADGDGDEAATPTALKATFALSGLGAVLEAARSAPVPVHVRGSAGVGVVYAGIGPGAGVAGVTTAVEHLRATCRRHGGSLTVLDGPAAVKDAVDLWGPVPGLDLMRRVKDQFDPDHRLAPGRFVGGI
jgi:glycolate oxidase FAD binding subunit